MIVDVFLNFIYYIFYAVLWIMPNGDPLPQSIHDMAMQFNSYANSVDVLFPVYDLMIPLSILITVTFGVVSFKAVKWILGFIRGSGTAGV